MVERRDKHSVGSRIGGYVGARESLKKLLPQASEYSMLSDYEQLPEANCCVAQFTKNTMGGDCTTAKHTTSCGKL